MTDQDRHPADNASEFVVIDVPNHGPWSWPDHVVDSSPDFAQAIEKARALRADVSEGYTAVIHCNTLSVLWRLDPSYPA